jgi:hypothetical protein
MGANSVSFDENTAKAAYQALLQVFKSAEHGPLEIEILPPSVTPPDGEFYVREENCIGIPKRSLVGAFIASRTQFEANTARSRLSDQVR